MADLVTFGEAMIRLSPPNFARVEQAHSLDLNAGGGEFNVAVAAARCGVSSAWVSRLTDNPLGKIIVNNARAQGVDTSGVVWTKGDRVGLYFLEFGASPRASSVIYDRASSAISKIKPGDVDWKKVFKGAKWFHTSGITPALSATALETTAQALKAAKEAGATTSYDLNYRSKLWTEDQAQAAQEPMMQFVDVLMTTEEDTKKVFKIKGGAAGDQKKIDVAAYKSVAEQLAAKFKFKTVIITLREDVSVLKNTWAAICLTGGKFFESPKHSIEIVDRVGGGDSLSGGYIAAKLDGKDDDYAIKFAVAFSALQHSFPGDYSWATKGEAEKLMAGGETRINR